MIMAWVEFIWLCIGTSDRFLWIW